MRILLLTMLPLLAHIACRAQAHAPQSMAIISTIDSVQSAFQRRYHYQLSAWWEYAVYHTANMEAYRLTQNSQYLEYSEKWAQGNKWMGARSMQKELWDYRRPLYEPTNVMFADWQACFQTYIDLFGIRPDSIRIARAIEVMDYQASLPQSDFWYWADALYMAMPVMSKLYKATGRKLYASKMLEWYLHADSLMRDKETGLYFRDTNYIYPKFQSPSGKKELWSRANGWVMAALAKAIPDTPKGCGQKILKKRLIAMAYAARERQQSGGYWTQNLDDPGEMPGYETSGTALITYAIIWGARSGILPMRDFRETISRAWGYLSSAAIQPGYAIGYIQDWGEKAMPGRPITGSSQTIYGTGCWILAAVEYCRLLDEKKEL